jgi:hypothetical protein
MYLFVFFEGYFSWAHISGRGLAFIKMWAMMICFGVHKDVGDFLIMIFCDFFFGIFLKK